MYGMYGFVTTSGSMYVLDTKKKVIEGGKLAHPYPYKKATIMIGDKAEIIIVDNEKEVTLRTSKVKNYIGGVI